MGQSYVSDTIIPIPPLCVSNPLPVVGTTMELTVNSVSHQVGYEEI